VSVGRGIQHDKLLANFWREKEYERKKIENKTEAKDNGCFDMRATVINW
jgi:hypothetical protein